MLIAYPIPAFYRQIDEPADALTGALWFNTSTNILKVLNSSSEWVNVAEEQDLMLKLIGNNALNILDITAQSSLTAGINANFERDIYTESDGYLATINTSNTTASFSLTPENNFQKILNYPYTAQTLTKNTAGGIGISVKDNIYIESIDKVSSCTGTRVRIFNSSSSVLGTANFSGNTATFSNPIYLNNGSYYWIEIDNNSSNYTRTGGTQDLPIQDKYFSVIGSIADGSRTLMTSPVQSMWLHNIYSIKIANGVFKYTNDGLNKLVETNAQTLDFTPTKFMIIANEETTGTGSVTYDISFDNGANWQEDLEAFTEYEVIETGAELILKQKLNAGASSGIASAYNWGVLLW